MLTVQRPEAGSTVTAAGAASARAADDPAHPVSAAAEGPMAREHGPGATGTGRAHLVDLLDQLRDAVDGLEARARTQVGHGARRTDEAVHAHPYLGMGAAAVVGLLLGLLAGRR